MGKDNRVKLSLVRKGSSMDKRKKESSLIQYNGIIVKIKKLMTFVFNGLVPKKQVFYVAGEKNALRPAMSRRQISSVKNRICKAAFKRFKGLD